MSGNPESAHASSPEAAGRPRASAKLIIGGLLLSSVLGPLLAMTGSVMTAASLTAGFYGMRGGGSGPGAVLLIVGMVFVFAGIVLVIVGLYNLLATFDAIGAKFLAAPPREYPAWQSPVQAAPRMPPSPPRTPYGPGE